VTPIIKKECLSVKGFEYVWVSGFKRHLHEEKFVDETERKRESEAKRGSGRWKKMPGRERS
jgi:hypothetical protein